MSLRLRVVILIGLIMLASMALGSLMAGVEVRHVLRAELAAGLAGAHQTANSAFEDIAQSDHPDRDLRQLVATFDGNRHVRASLFDPEGRVVARSDSAETGPPPPNWFRRMVEVSPPALALRVPVAGGMVLVLAPLPEPDVRAAWSELLALTLVVAGAAAGGLLLVYPVIGAALRELTRLAAQTRQIGAGDYSGRVAEAGPPEIVNLQRGFNQMAAELGATRRRNLQLSDQLVRLQDEERADIARDLHDEIGPYLFAVNLDAGMIAQLCEAGRHDAIPDRVREIQGAVRHLQRQVRDLLGLLRPAQVTELGLGPAVADLVRLWSTRQPGITFDVAVSAETVPEAVAEVAYRIVQEAVSNAVRHGQPDRISIVVAHDDAASVGVTVADNGAVAASAARVAGGGLGLVGMRERIEASGGSLNFGPNLDGPGWTVTARINLVANGNAGR